MLNFTSNRFKLNSTTLCVLLASFSMVSASAQSSAMQNTKDDKPFYVKPIVGIGFLSDQSADITNLLEQTGNAEIELDAGFNAGLSAGYRYFDHLVIELSWEYRSNDSTSVIPNNEAFDGNYASSILAANAYYSFIQHSNYEVYAGLGLVYSQEIDLDLEDNIAERSLSASGDVGFQFFLGARYQVSKQWYLSGQARYMSISNIRLEAEENLDAGEITGLNYRPIGLEIGIEYWF